jgi:hypothetical protein
VASFEQTLTRLAADLDATGVQWAIVGGLAVSARSQPRTTRDIDVAVAAGTDSEAERAILALRRLGYQDAGEVIEQDVTGRLATMRMVSPGDDDPGVVDLIFASTGIEPEIVAAASSIEILPGVTVRVASLGHLLAMKVLAGRAQDVADFASLFNHASATDLEAARQALRLVTNRGTHREKDLLADFGRLSTDAKLGNG